MVTGEEKVSSFSTIWTLKSLIWITREEKSHRDPLKEDNHVKVIFYYILM